MRVVRKKGCVGLGVDVGVEEEDEESSASSTSTALGTPISDSVSGVVFSSFFLTFDLNSPSLLSNSLPNMALSSSRCCFSRA